VQLKLGSGWFYCVRESLVLESSGPRQFGGNPNIYLLYRQYSSPFAYSTQIFTRRRGSSSSK
jgi:hypothetical protein